MAPTAFLFPSVKTDIKTTKMTCFWIMRAAGADSASTTMVHGATVQGSSTWRGLQCHKRHANETGLVSPTDRRRNHICFGGLELSMA